MRAYRDIGFDGLMRSDHVPTLEGAYQIMAFAPADRYMLLRGRPTPPPARAPLRCAKLDLEIEGGDICSLRVGSVELIRRCYAAVRDQNWGTIAAEVVATDLRRAGEAFTLSVESTYRSGEIVMDAQTEISCDGAKLAANFAGVARSSFRYNRIGLCVLHPSGEFAGSRYRATTPAGPVEGTLPRLIGAQAPFVGAFEQLELESCSGALLRFTFEGDLFEIEDQRNWTDASFKTYSTPLSLGFPHEAESGQRFEQRIVVDFDRLPRPRRSRPSVARIVLGDPLGHSLPRLGLGMPSGQTVAGDSERALLRAVGAEHVRASIHVGDADFETRLGQSFDLARALGARPQVVLTIDGDARTAFDRLARFLSRAGGDIGEVIVFRSGVETTSGADVRLARERLAHALPRGCFYGGTDANFYELNRATLDLDGVDGVAYSIQPQVHASDDASIVETLEVQGETVAGARALVGTRSVIVGAVTFKARRKPVSAKPDALDLAHLVDPRQASLLGAAWTAGSLKYLAEAAASAVTYFEAIGWLGLLPPPEETPPVGFPSKGGKVFPLYHTLADASAMTGSVLAATSSDPLAVVALAVADAGRMQLLVANLRPVDVSGDIVGLPRRSLRIRRLNEETGLLAVNEPAKFRESWSEVTGGPRTFRLELRPYEVVRLDASE